MKQSGSVRTGGVPGRFEDDMAFAPECEQQQAWYSSGIPDGRRKLGVYNEVLGELDALGRQGRTMN